MRDETRLTKAFKEFEAAYAEACGIEPGGPDEVSLPDAKPSPLAFAIAVHVELMMAVPNRTSTMAKARAFQHQIDRAASEAH